MNVLDDWLAPYKKLESSELFLSELKKRVVLPTETDDPAKYLKVLMGKVDQFIQSSSRNRDRFLDREIPSTVTFSPDSAIAGALETLDEMPTLEPDTASFLALSYVKAGEMGGAELCAAMAYAMNDRSPAVLGILVGKALGEKNEDVAASLVEVARELHPDSPETIYGEARLFLSTGEFGPATKTLESLTERYPGYIPAWELLLNCHILLENWTAGIVCADKAPPALGKKQGFLKTLAHCHQRLGDTAKTRAILVQITTLLSASGSHSQHELANALIELAHFDETRGEGPQAQASYTAALKASPNNPDTICSVAEGLTRIGELSIAESVIDNAIASYTNHPDLLTAAGKLRFAQGRDQEAFDLLQHVVELDGSNTEAVFTMALVCLKNGELPLALELATTVAGSDARLAPQAWMVIGDTLRLAGQKKDALDAYGSALALAEQGSAAKEEIEHKIARLENN